MAEDQEYGGPYLQTAVFCERILKEADGVASLIRIVDRVMIQASGPQPPEKMPPTRLALWAYLAFKSGFAKGSFTISVKAQSPSGKVLPPVLLPIFLEGDDRGASVAFQLNLDADEDGLYWFDISMGERLITRMPLRIVYQRTSLGRGPN